MSALSGAQVPPQETSCLLHLEEPLAAISTPELFLSRVHGFPDPGAPHPSPNSSLGSVSWPALPTSEPRVSMELARPQEKQRWTL